MTKTITYLATNQKNGKWYVGSTTQSFASRKRSHLKSLESDAFHRSLRKNPNNFVWEILSEVEADSADRSHEQEILDVWFNTAYCYNLSSRATGMCPIIAKKVGKKTKNFTGTGNLPHVREQRSKMCHARHSEKDDNGKSKWAVKMGKSAHSRRTEDGKSAVSVENSKHIAGINKRAVELTLKETGETYIFDSALSASTSLGLNHSHITSMCRGRRKSHKGYTARYLED